MIDFRLDNHFWELNLDAKKFGNDCKMDFSIFEKIATLFSSNINELFYSINIPFGNHSVVPRL